MEIYFRDKKLLHQVELKFSKYLPIYLYTYMDNNYEYCVPTYNKIYYTYSLNKMKYTYLLYVKVETELGILHY